MIGVVVPAHNEQALLPSWLRAIGHAANHAGLGGESVTVVVVADHCTDRTVDVAQARGVTTLQVSERNVGAARAVGAEWLLGKGVRWLAFTDADTIVRSDWLVAQLALGADAVCGVVAVRGWRWHPRAVRVRYEACYVDGEGHRHIHGANLGVSALAYTRAGGMPRLAVGEDVALVAALERTGSTVAWSAMPRVVTSARRDARARNGFGDHLLSLTTHAAAMASP